MQACKLYTQSSLPYSSKKEPRRILYFLAGGSAERSSDSIFTRQREDTGTSQFFGKNILFEIVPQEIDSPQNLKHNHLLDWVSRRRPNRIIAKRDLGMFT